MLVMLPDEASAAAARLIGVAEFGMTMAPVVGARRLAVGGVPTAEVTTKVCWMSRARPVLSVARIVTTCMPGVAEAV